MGKWIEKQDLKNETKEKNRIRREKIAGYFLNLSQLTFVALVLVVLHLCILMKSMLLVGCF